MRQTHRILHAQHHKSDLTKILSDSKNLNGDKQNMLYDILTKYELLFDRTLETWKTKHTYIEVQP